MVTLDGPIKINLNLLHRKINILIHLRIRFKIRHSIVLKVFLACISELVFPPENKQNQAKSTHATDIMAFMLRI